MYGHYFLSVHLFGEQINPTVLVAPVCPAGRVEAGESCGCEPGYEWDQQFGCRACVAGYFKSTVFTQCSPCQGSHLTSRPGATSPSDCVCGPLFFASTDHETGSSRCYLCPASSVCSRPESQQINVTLGSLGLRPGYWRASGRTKSIYHCQAGLCLGGTDATQYCRHGNGGALCETCLEPHHYLIDSGECQACPSHGALPLLPFVALALTLVVLFWRGRTLRRSANDLLRRKSTTVASFATGLTGLLKTAKRMGLVACLKQCLSYYQVASDHPPPPTSYARRGQPMSCQGLTSI